jgi:plastocyanin
LNARAGSPLALLAVLCTVAAHGAELKVTVVDDTTAPVRDSIVYAVPEKPATQKPRAALIDQKNRQFVPQVLAVQVGASVSFPNSDNVRHSVYSFSEPNRFELKLYAGKAASPVVFPKPGIVALGCNIHDKMIAWVLVVDTPYFARTDASGQATLKGLEPGAYTLRAWRSAMRKEQAGEALEINDSEPVPRQLRVPSAEEPRVADMQR